jgi:hypothetical protein
MIAVTLASIFIYRPSSVIHKIIGSTLEVDFCVMINLDINIFKLSSLIPVLAVDTSFYSKNLVFPVLPGQ